MKDTEPCRAADPNDGSEYNDPKWGVRDHSGSHKDKAKQKTRNRKAAKAARKARKQ